MSQIGRASPRPRRISWWSGDQSATNYNAERWCWAEFDCCIASHTIGSVVESGRYAYVLDLARQLWSVFAIMTIFCLKRLSLRIKYQASYLYPSRDCNVTFSHTPLSSQHSWGASHRSRAPNWPITECHSQAIHCQELNWGENPTTSAAKAKPCSQRLVEIRYLSNYTTTNKPSTLHRCRTSWWPASRPQNLIRLK